MLLLIAGPAANPQDNDERAAIDYNRYYQFPLAIGTDFSFLSPLNQGMQSISVLDFGAYARTTLPGAPSLQPTGRVGVMRWNVDDPDVGPERFSHDHLYATIGMGYANRFAREFEFGIEAGVGAGQSYFANLDPSGALVGDQNLIGTASARITLAPSYAFAIDIAPALRYVRPLGEALQGMEMYSGPSFGVGISLNYRFGDDPDADGGIIRNIRVDHAHVNEIFPAQQSYYVNNAMGSVTFTNSSDQPITNVSVGFLQSNYMDAPSRAGGFERIEPGETVSVDLVAAFNSQIFDTQGITPLTGEVIFDYTFRTRGVQQRHSVDFDMYDRNALTWDDTERFAAFVTPSDSLLQNFGSFALQATRDLELNGIPQPVQTAMSIYYALEVFGIDYQRDPVIPFDEAQANPLIVDTVSLGRETLQRRAGECDDLTALYNGLLEGVRVETGFVATPGHLYAMFNTEVDPENYRLVHPDPDMTLEIDGELWVPIEITLIGRGTFMQAWREGINEYRRHANNPEVRELHKTRVAQVRYRPVVLTRSELAVDFGQHENVADRFAGGLDELTNAILLDFEELAQAGARPQDYNQLGIVAGDFDRFDVAERAFNTALVIDRNFVAAQINLGQLYRLQNRPQQALRSLHRAEEQTVDLGRQRSPNYPRILLTIAELYYGLENYDRAREYFFRLEERDPDTASEHRYLAERAGRTSNYRPPDRRMADTQDD